MTEEPRHPDLSFVVQAANENRWSDLLASLIATDPAPIQDLVGGLPDAVRREVVVAGQVARGSDRLDILLIRDEKQLAMIEAKVLADLGPQQLARYEAAFPEAESRFVLHLESLPLSLGAAPRWRPMTWEEVLRAFSESPHPWVAATARAWLLQLDTLVPRVDADTVWNEVPDDAAGFELALRTRVAWLANRMDAWCELEHDLEPSSGGGAWVASMRVPSPFPRHKVIAEIQEGLPTQAWRVDPARLYRDRLPGPVVLVGLSQSGVTTSADFDWDLLHRLFRNRIIDQAGVAIDDRSWQLTSANPRDATDRTNWQAMVSAGAPRWIGKGYGMATARTHAVCAFGARIQLDPRRTLGQIDAELQDLQTLIIDMAGSEAP